MINNMSHKMMLDSERLAREMVMGIMKAVVVEKELVHIQHKKPRIQIIVPPETARDRTPDIIRVDVGRRRLHVDQRRNLRDRIRRVGGFFRSGRHRNGQTQHGCGRIESDQNLLLRKADTSRLGGGDGQFTKPDRELRSHRLVQLPLA